MNEKLIMEEENYYEPELIMTRNNKDSFMNSVLIEQN